MFSKIPFWLWSKAKLYEGYFKGLFHIVAERIKVIADLNNVWLSYELFDFTQNQEI